MNKPVRALVFAAVAIAGGASSGMAQSLPPDEPIEVTVCRTIEGAAKAQELPIAFLTRLIWQESSFRTQVVSPAGAQGIAQFMPGTAGDWKLANPFDPAEAIPKAAALLASLKQRFGNLGLAAAAYNAGASRVANWLGGHGTLPEETRHYVLTITERPVETWASKDAEAPPSGTSDLSCLQLAALIRKAEPNHFTGSVLMAPWGVQLAGSFSKQAALAAYERASGHFHRFIGDVQPMIIGGRAPDRGFSPFYRIRVPAASRADANALCGKIQRAGGACAVLRS